MVALRYTAYRATRFSFFLQPPCQRTNGASTSSFSKSQALNDSFFNPVFTAGTERAIAIEYHTLSRVLKNSLFRQAVQKCSDARRAKTSRGWRIREIRRTRGLPAQRSRGAFFNSLLECLLTSPARSYAFSCPSADGFHRAHWRRRVRLFHQSLVIAGH